MLEASRSNACHVQITALAFAPDGRGLFTSDEEGALCAWDLDTAKRLWDAPAAHSGAVWSLAVSNGAGTLLASGAPLPCCTLPLARHQDLSSCM